MNIITIPTDKLIRFLPGGSECRMTQHCSSPSLARIDSSRMLMTYLAATDDGGGRVCGCYLDEEFMVDSRTNVIFGSNEANASTGINLFQDGARIISIPSFMEVALITCLEQPILYRYKVVPYSNNTPRFPFVINGNLMALTDDLDTIVGLFWGYDGYDLLPAPMAKYKSIVGLFSGFASSGDGLIGFSGVGMNSPQDRVAVFQMNMDRNLSVTAEEHPVFTLPEMEWIGTPLRHANGWAIPFSDADKVCKIAIV